MGRPSLLTPERREEIERQLTDVNGEQLFNCEP